jgi:hypothetical protein
MGRMVFVPEGQCDRSLARSAWESPPKRSRPVGYGLILAGVRTSIGDWSIGMTVSDVKTEDIHVFGTGPSHRRAARTSVRDALSTRKISGISSARSYRTLRDGSSGDASPGTSCLATIILPSGTKTFARRSSGFVIFAAFCEISSPTRITALGKCPNSSPGTSLPGYGHTIPLGRNTLSPPRL